MARSVQVPQKGPLGSNFAANKWAFVYNGNGAIRWGAKVERKCEKVFHSLAFLSSTSLLSPFGTLFLHSIFEFCEKIDRYFEKIKYLHNN